jgi:hypothetical protein
MPSQQSRKRSHSVDPLHGADAERDAKIRATIAAIRKAA